jgi:predicted MPP superfamily phosphohydrolase
VLVLLGDAVQDGEVADADRDTAEVADAALATGLPVLAARGNHDIAPEQYTRLFKCRPGLHEFGGYGLLLFEDEFNYDLSATRPADQLAWPPEAAAENPDRPLIAIQHNPIYPPIVAEYPYIPTNAGEILAGYRQAGLVLSVSGHFHEGQPPVRHNGTLFSTLPCAADRPHPFAVARLDGRQVGLELLNLEMS